MKKRLFIYFFVFVSGKDFSQTIDTTRNNLIHDIGYKTSELGALPEYIKMGKGSLSMILIPGLGFDASVFNDFMEANKSNYTMYSITIPGFGKTLSPPMPASGSSYGKSNWTNGVIKGIKKLIDKEKIQNPVIVGHFTVGTQIALKFGIDHPELIKGIIILGGPAKMIFTYSGEINEYPAEKMISIVDSYTAPVWFKHMREQDWDEGNYLPEVYSLDSLNGNYLWNQVAAVPVPVMVHYLCEFIALDLKAELFKIKCPTLILRPVFNEMVLKSPINNYIVPQFIDSWNSASDTNKLIQVVDIHNSASFVWKDSPKLTYKLIKDFIKGL